MLLKRWITGLVALPLLVALILKGGPVAFLILAILVCMLSLWEYFRIVFSHWDGIMQSPIILLAFLTGPLIIVSAYTNSTPILLALLAFNLIIAGLLSLFRFKHDPAAFELVTKQILGLVYIPVFLSYLILIRNGVNGDIWILSYLFIIFAGDTGAFFVGTYLGRHKLCPAVSPGKTIEGAVGGLVANLAMAAILKLLVLAISWHVCILFSLAVGSVGQAGDLFESEIKRSANIKDSGGILPGHGGMLDRIDALLFAAPVAYFILKFTGYG
ncbi:phosphatidate cytidylyltransferase [Thermodesulfobacteriota bacterium]